MYVLCVDIEDQSDGSVTSCLFRFLLVYLDRYNLRQEREGEEKEEKNIMIIVVVVVVVSVDFESVTFEGEAKTSIEYDCLILFDFSLK